MIEIWKNIPGFENIYQISNLGRVRSCDRIIQKKNYQCDCFDYPIKGKILSQVSSSQNKLGQPYFSVSLSISGNKTRFLVHRLVAQSFIPNPDNKPHINHIDGNPSNNYVENLEWCTDSENRKHAWDTGLQGKGSRKSVNQYTLTGDPIKTFRSITEAVKIMKGGTKEIPDCCNNKRGSYKNYKWKWNKDEI